MKAIDRLIAKADTASDCWIWRGAVNQGAGGYGWFSLNGDATLAHRASWVLHNGPIPDGMHVLHRCDVRLCINPSHLFLGTNNDNVADKVAKGRTAHGEGHARNGLSAEKALAVRHATGTVREIGRRLGVSASHVSAIRRGVYWRSLT